MTDERELRDNLTKPLLVAVVVLFMLGIKVGANLLNIELTVVGTAAFLAFLAFCAWLTSNWFRNTPITQTDERPMQAVIAAQTPRLVRIETALSGLAERQDDQDTRLTRIETKLDTLIERQALPAPAPAKQTVDRDSPQLNRVLRHFDQFPKDRELSTRALAEKLDVGRGTAERAKHL